MNINEAFPSNYIKASDLKGKDINLVIERIGMEDIGGDHKPVVYFRGAEKGMVLNKTNGMNIATMYGPETDAWIGKGVTLYPAWVDFQGRSVEAVRVRPVAPQEHQAPAAPPVTDSIEQSAKTLDDDITFS